MRKITIIQRNNPVIMIRKEMLYPFREKTLSIQGYPKAAF